MSRSKQRTIHTGARSDLGPPRRRRMHSVFATGLLPLASAIIACLNTAQAQEAASGGTLEEVVVTAQKRTESLQDVPLSITALGTQKLDELNVQNVDDYIKFLPSVSYQTNGARARPSSTCAAYRAAATARIRDRRRASACIWMNSRSRPSRACSTCTCTISRA